MEYRDETIVSHNWRTTYWWDWWSEVHGHSRHGLHFVREEGLSFDLFISLKIVGLEQCKLTLSKFPLSCDISLSLSLDS